ncbi:MAG: TIGR01459 family HAD-type hydrolase [Alphaproteobacteria bacterium]|nr:TIGR01459 family HAD-type hydrolase [Alphaproteobacteria bacterium]
MMTIAILPGLAPLAARYDAFIIDMWGVIHDGATAYPSAVATLKALREAGKATLLLSNAPRRANSLVETMTSLGIPRHLYGEVLSSGEAVNDEIRTRRDPFYAALGQRCYHIGPEHDSSVFEDLSLTLVSDPAQAEFVVNTGPWGPDDTVADFEPVLVACAARHLPMVCANPDHEVIREGRRAICAGALAARYQELGGVVSYRGKPDPAIYELCLERLGVTDRRRVLAIGDGMETDIAGGAAAGIDTVLVAGGLHADELGASVPGAMPDAGRVTALCDRFRLRPIAAIPALAF